MQPPPWTARVAFVGALVAAAVLAPVASAPVSAADPARQLAAVSAEVNQLGNQYFTATTRLHAIDADLAHLRTERAHVEREYAAEHRLAVRRAVARYTQGSVTVPMNASDALDEASESVILQQAAATTNSAMDHYVQVRTTMLDTEHRLDSQQRAQRALVNELAARTQTLNRDLASAQRSYREELAARAAQANAAEAAAQRAHTTPPSSASAHTTTPPPVPPSSTQPVSTPPPPSPAGTNPHHGDPFLSCVRNHESRGDYGAVNPGGYYGAYQFAPTTWNISASHAGMPGLIGVRPDHASAWDQDQVAWVLYQWQGAAPWSYEC
jgi:hypothetical protein